MTIAKWREETSTAQPPYRQAGQEKRLYVYESPGWISNGTLSVKSRRLPEWRGRDVGSRAQSCCYGMSPIHHVPADRAALPPRPSSSIAAAPTPHHNAAPCRAACSAAATLFDYGRLWGSFSKGSLRNEGGICSTVVKTVGSLQFCNERDAKARQR